MPRLEPIRILQVGDIHFPGAIKRRPDADLKRDPFDVSDEVAPEGLRIQKITQHLSQYKSDFFDAIAFMGDFTTGHPDVDAHLSGMDRCFDYIDLNIVRPLLGRRSHTHCLFVPGNHDVDRTRCPSKPMARFDKFEHYINSLSARGQTKLSVTEISRIEISKESSSAFLFGINTCLGCGEFLSFPDDIKKDLVARLESVTKKRAGPIVAEVVDKFLDLTERLDAPLIDGNILNQLDSEINRRAHDTPNAVHLVIGHHNLLPQIVPRVAPFSELMNSGELRSFLSSKDSAVIYLHGHIHDDPIEIIFNQSNQESCVIAVSAPEFVDGYNVIEIYFDDEGAPLGIVVQGVRQDGVGKITKQEPRRIPLRQGPHRIAAITAIARDIFYRTFSQNTQLHFNDIAKEYADHPIDSIERAILELEWLGLVQIANRTRSAHQWNVSSAV